MAFRRGLATLLLLSFPLSLLSSFGEGDLSLNYYSESCPRGEDIVKEEVAKLYHKHGNTAVSWVRNLFHDCMVKSCDASLLLETTHSIISEQASQRSFGMRNFKYITTIKDALERECPNTVSCADVVALSAREGVLWVCLNSKWSASALREPWFSYWVFSFVASSFTYNKGLFWFAKRGGKKVQSTEEWPIFS